MMIKRRMRIVTPFVFITSLLAVRKGKGMLSSLWVNPPFL